MERRKKPIPPHVNILLDSFYDVYVFVIPSILVFRINERFEYSSIRKLTSQTITTDIAKSKWKFKNMKILKNLSDFFQNFRYIKSWFLVVNSSYF